MIVMERFSPCSGLHKIDLVSVGFIFVTYLMIIGVYDSFDLLAALLSVPILQLQKNKKKKKKKEKKDKKMEKGKEKEKERTIFTYRSIAIARSELTDT